MGGEHSLLWEAGGVYSGGIEFNRSREGCSGQTIATNIGRRSQNTGEGSGRVHLGRRWVRL
jgi:hypothetical protein